VQMQMNEVGVRHGDNLPPPVMAEQERDVHIGIGQPMTFGEGCPKKAAGFGNHLIYMSNRPGIGLVCLLLVWGLGPGCKPKSGPAAKAPAAYFQTPFQTESEFIVQAVVCDLAAQMTYAASRRLPDQANFSVMALEKPGSPPDAPVYEVRVSLGPKRDLKMEVKVNGPTLFQGQFRSFVQSHSQSPRRRMAQSQSAAGDRLRCCPAFEPVKPGRPAGYAGADGKAPRISPLLQPDLPLSPAREIPGSRQNGS
jgi:hypothetical protein